MKIIFTLLLVVAGLSGCATVLKTPVQNISVRSVPAGAEVQTSNGKTGITPYSFFASRRKDCRVTISKEGYQTINVQLVSGHSTTGTLATTANAVVGGLIGVGIDYATGSTWELRPDPVLVRLSPSNSPTPSVMLQKGSRLEELTTPSPRKESEKIPKKSVPKRQPSQSGTDANGTEYL